MFSDKKNKFLRTESYEMANINDILNRDHRTTQHPLPRKVVNSNENSNKNILARCVCDNCLINSGTRKHLLIINSGFRKVLARSKLLLFKH